MKKAGGRGQRAEGTRVCGFKLQAIVSTLTRFQVRADFLSRYSIKTVGGSIHQEYWIPAQDLAQFNRNIVGLIEVVAEFGLK